MRHDISFIAVVLLMVIAVCLSAATLAAQGSAATLGDATRIEADSAANLIRFYIDGREQAVLDADGLHVRGSIDYTGTITDGNHYSLSSGKEGADAE